MYVHGVRKLCLKLSSAARFFPFIPPFFSDFWRHQKSNGPVRSERRAPALPECGAFGPRRAGALRSAVTPKNKKTLKNLLKQQAPGYEK